MKRYSNSLHLILIGIIVVGCGYNVTTDYPGIKKINQSSANLFFPVWSPTNREIVVSSIIYPQYRSSILKYDTITGKKTVILESGGILRAQSWSPDGNLIAFASSRTDKFKEDGIWIIDSNGENPSYVGPGESATWSSDGQKLAVLSCDQNSEDNISIIKIRVIDLTTEVEEEIYSENQCASNSYIDWSSDGKFLAFSFYPDSNLNSSESRVRVLNINTGKIRVLAEVESWGPSWSPKGDMLVFGQRGKHDLDSKVVIVSNDDRTCSVTVTDLNTRGVISWSNDGTKLAIADGYNLFVLDITSFMGENFLVSGITCQ